MDIAAAPVDFSAQEILFQPFTFCPLFSPLSEEPLLLKALPVGFVCIRKALIVSANTYSRRQNRSQERHLNFLSGLAQGRGRGESCKSNTRKGTGNGEKRWK